MRKVHVVVTEEDIKNGKPLDNNNCPIALAVKRQLGLSFDNVQEKLKEGEKFTRVFTETSDIRTIKNGWEETVETASNPPEAIDFIRAFDTNWNEDKIKPFEFDLEFREL